MTEATDARLEGSPATGRAGDLARRSKPPVLPLRDEFPDLRTPYLDAAYMHPIGRGARAAVDRYLAFRARGGGDTDLDLPAMREKVCPITG